MSTDAHERKPDTITLTFETTIDVVVDLDAGTWKMDDVGQLADEPHYAQLFAEGEFAAEYELRNWMPVQRHSDHQVYEDDTVAIAKALAIMSKSDTQVK